MCTVVFIPKNNKLIFASLRDESPVRQRAISPEIFNSNDLEFLAPQDSFAGGTWLGVNDRKNVIILLNGGFENHKRADHYRKSRGLIVMELLASETPAIDWVLIDLKDIEPFTLLVWSCEMLFQFVWDGSKKHSFKLNSNIPHILSSSTLYSLEAKRARQDFFEKWIALDPAITKLALHNFFRSMPDGENGFIINRNEIMKTLSYSFIELSTDNVAELDYYDLQNFSHTSKRISIKTSDTDCPLI